MKTYLATKSLTLHQTPIILHIAKEHGGGKVGRAVIREGSFSVAKDEAADAAKLFGVPVNQFESVIPKLDPYECPGLRLEMAVSRAQDASAQPAASSDEPDRAHIVFLPYVDLAFADRRTVGFLEQESKKPSNGSMHVDVARLRRSVEPAAMMMAIREAAAA